MPNFIAINPICALCISENPRSTATQTFTLTVRLSCAQGALCTVGVDTGPGGGIVFYYSATAFTSTGSACGTNCHYLEAAPSDQGSAEWCSNTSTLINVPAWEIGLGMANTTTADSTCTSGAIQVAADYINNSLSDWFLPSADELNELCKYARNTGQAADTSIACADGYLRTGFASGFYWSSSESDAGTAWNQTFNYGTHGRNYKAVTYYVRPVRAF